MDRQLVLHISKFPMPPTVNKLYAWSPTYRRMIKTRDYRKYDKEIAQWYVEQNAQVVSLRSFIKDLGSFVLHVDALFLMPRTQIVCKDGRLKKNDTSNRLKALHDVLSEVMQIDDSYFWSGSFDKKAIDSKDGYVDLTLMLKDLGKEKRR